MSITFSLVPSTAAASAVYIEQEAVSRSTGSAVIPHKIIVLGQYNSGYSPTVNTAQEITDTDDAWTRYGRGSMLSLMLERVIDNSGGVDVYALPVADDDSGVVATGTITVTEAATAAGTLAIYIGGESVDVSVASEDTADTVGAAIATAINADLDLPITASNTSGVVTLTCRWAGESGNQIDVEINRDDSDETPAGLTVVAVDMASGTNNPDIETALATMLADNNWYTVVANPYLDTDNLGYIASAGTDAADPSIKQMFASFTGYTDTISNFITTLDNYNSQYISFMPVPGSPTPAFLIAAAAASIFGRYQQINPGRPIKNLTLPDVEAGDQKMRDYADTVVIAGGSWTINQSDDTVTIGDSVTTKTTTSTGASTTDWRFTIIIGNIQFKIYALDEKFSSSPFDRAVVLADGGGRGPSYAIRPSTVKAYAIGLVDDWIERGLSTSRADIVDNIEASVDDDNSGRINLLIPDIASSGLRILAAKLEWGFLV